MNYLYWDRKMDIKINKTAWKLDIELYLIVLKNDFTDFSKISLTNSLLILNNPTGEKPI